jgi:hypothetical protein
VPVIKKGFWERLPFTRSHIRADSRLSGSMLSDSMFSVRCVPDSGADFTENVNPGEPDTGRKARILTHPAPPARPHPGRTKVPDHEQLEPACIVNDIERSLVRTRRAPSTGLVAAAAVEVRAAPEE